MSVPVWGMDSERKMVATRSFLMFFTALLFWSFSKASCVMVAAIA